MEKSNYLSKRERERKKKNNNVLVYLHACKFSLNKNAWQQSKLIVIAAFYNKKYNKKNKSILFSPQITIVKLLVRRQRRWKSSNDKIIYFHYFHYITLITKWKLNEFTILLLKRWWSSLKIEFILTTFFFILFFSSKKNIYIYKNIHFVLCKLNVYDICWRSKYGDNMSSLSLVLTPRFFYNFF